MPGKDTPSRDQLLQKVADLHCRVAELEASEARLKQSEELLRQSEEKYRVLFNNEIYAICIFDLESLQLLDVNEAYTRLYGYSREELLSGMTINDITAEHQRSNAATQQAVREGTIFIPLRYHRKKDGTVFPVEIVGGPYQWQGRKVMFALARDIAQRKQAEAALARERTLLRTIIDLLPDTIYAKDEAGRKTVCNRAELLHLGAATEAEVLGKTDADFYLPTLAVEFEADDRAVIQNGISLINREEISPGPDGQPRWFLTNKVPLRDETGQVVGLVGVGRDITELKQAIEALHQNKQLLDAFFAQAMDGFFFMMLDEPIHWDNTIDKETMLDYVFAHQRITRVNTAILEQYGATPEQFIGRTPADFFAHDITQGRAVWRQFFDQGRLHIETNERKFDGSSMWVEGDYICLYDAAGRITGHFGVQRDTTERKQAEESLRLQHELAIVLSASQNLDEALSYVLETALRVDGIDCGGLYLVNPTSGGLDLAIQRGLSAQFLAQATHYEADTPQVNLARAGQPLYGHYADIHPVLDEALAQEGLRGVAIIPILHQQELIAVLNLASHTHDNISTYTRSLLETLALQTGSALVRLRAEEALRESRLNLQTLFDTIDDFLFVLDGEGCIRQVNQVVCRRLGYSNHEIRGRNVLEVHPPDRRDEAAQIVAAMLANQEDYCPVPLQTQKGTLIPVETRVTQGTWSGQPALFGISRDITERKQAEAEREKLIVELQTALNQVKRLSGLLPICASCKKIRDDRGYWQQIELYIREHSEADFSHGICPDCMAKLYPKEKYPFLYQEK